MLVELLTKHGSAIGELAHDSKQALHWALANDIIFWYTKFYQTGDNMAWAFCAEKYNVLANLMNWDLA